MPVELTGACQHGAYGARMVASPMWGWEIAIYLFLGGIVAGLLLLPAARELAGGGRPRSRPLQLMPFAAIGLISLGMLMLFLDLHYKVHAWRFYLAFKPTSPMSWGAWILLVVYPAAFFLGLGSLSEALRRPLRESRLVRALRLDGLLRWCLAFADDSRRGILWVAALAGTGLGLYTGLLLGTMVARVQWHSALLGPLFLTSGISTGAAFMLLFPLAHDEERAFVRYDIAAIATELVLLGLVLVTWLAGGHAAERAAASFLGGAWTAPFWGLVVGMGLVVPLLMEVLELRRRLLPAILTPLFILGGGLALRAIILAAGQAPYFCVVR